MPRRDPFDDAVTRALAMLPPQLRAAMAHLVLTIEDAPDRETLDRLGIDDPDDLLGVFEGAPLPEQEHTPPTGKLPERIRLFRDPILRHCAETGERIEDCVRDTVIHEIGHFFGYSDDELAAHGF